MKKDARVIETFRVINVDFSVVPYFPAESSNFMFMKRPLLL